MEIILFIVVAMVVFGLLSNIKEREDRKLDGYDKLWKLLDWRRLKKEIEEKKKKSN